MEISNTIKLILLGVLGLFDIICLGLLAYYINKVTGSFNNGFGYSYRTSSPSEVNFMMFNTVFTLLVIFYLAVIPRIVPKLFHNVIALAVCALSTLFWFAGSIALAVIVGVGGCDGLPDSYCRPYRSVQAATAFGFFIWIIFTVLTVFELLGFLKGGFRKKSGDNSAQMTTQQPVYANA